MSAPKVGTAAWYVTALASTHASWLKMSMHSKNQFLQRRHEQSPKKRLKSNVQDLLLQGQISGKRAASLFTDARSAQAEGLEDVSNISQDSHAPRNLQRKFAKNNPWPPLYVAKAHMKDLATEETIFGSLHMLLPHEICFCCGQWNKDAGNKPFEHGGLTHLARQQFLDTCKQHGLDVNTTFPLGFSVDGVPVKWDRSESLLVFTLNLPGQGRDEFKRIRLPITVINKKFVVKETVDDILNVVVWGFRCLLVGLFPAARLPGMEASNNYGWRKKHASPRAPG